MEVREEQHELASAKLLEKSQLCESCSVLVQCSRVLAYMDSPPTAAKALTFGLGATQQGSAGGRHGMLLFPAQHSWLPSEPAAPAGQQH